jgi:hypothetical protein
MLTVGLFSWNGDADRKIAEIAWDGETFTGSGTEMVFFGEPIRLRSSGRIVTAKSDPELFMRSLCLQYKGAYLRASAAIEKLPRI